MKFKVVYQSGDIVTVKKVEFSNEVGGTEFLEGSFQIRILSSSNDYETGSSFKGNLIDKADIAKAKKQGTVSTTLQDYEKYGKDSQIYQKMIKVFATRSSYSPNPVYVYSSDIVKPNINMTISSKDLI